MKLKHVTYPESGDIRTRLKFAWFPTYIVNNKVWIWLEQYKVMESYYVGNYDSHWCVINAWTKDVPMN